MIKLKDILNEGIHDKSTLKGVILTGGPASGKSTLVRSLFGFDKTLKNVNLSSTGFKMVDIDYYFQYILKKRGFSLDLNYLSKTVPNWDKLRQDMRSVAMDIMLRQRKVFVDERLGVILDGVQDDIQKLMTRKKELEDLGYDVIVIFVDVPLDIVLDRNRKRERTLEEDLVKKMWKNCQDNKQKLMQILGDSFHITSTEDTKDIEKVVRRFTEEPIKNPIGKKWLELKIKLERLRDKT